MGQRVEQTFHKRRFQVDSKHLVRCLTSLVIREMQTETTNTYYSIATRLAKILNGDNIKHQESCGAMVTLLKD